MTEIYISTPTKAAYEALMGLADSKGYHWSGGYKATDPALREIAYREDNCQVVHLNSESMEITRCSHDYLFMELCIKVETIPLLEHITALYKMETVDWDEYVHTHPVDADRPIMLETLVELDNGSVQATNRKACKALAVEYKPLQGEDTFEKVKLPSFVCEQISRLKGNQGIEKISKPNEAVDFMNRLSKMYGKSHVWLSDSKENQWKLIDALRNGYEPELEEGESL